MNTNNSGFGIIEIIIAMGLFVIVVAGGVTVVLQGHTLNRLGLHETYANAYAQEGVEAVLSLQKRSMSNISPGTYGLTGTGNQWAFSGSSDTRLGFTRQIIITQGQRSGSTVVDSGGTPDTNLYKVTSTASWTFSPTRTNSVTHTTYLTNYTKTLIGNWSSVTQVGPVDLAGNDDGLKIASEGNYAYLIRSTGTPNLVVFDVSNPASPTTVGSLTLTSGLTNIFVSGTRLYVTSSENAAELRIIDVSTPASPTVIGTYNAPGNENANDIYVSGTTGYLVRSNGGNQEFVILNLTTPASVSVTGSLNLTGSALEVTGVDTLALIASDSDAQELQVISTATPASPSLLGTYDATGNNNALSVAGFSNVGLIGRDNGDLLLISTATPASPSLLSTFAAGTRINDISLGNANTYAFLATSNTTAEFRVVNITNTSSPVSLSTSNLAGNALGISYNSTLDRAFLTTASNTQELLVIQPN